MENEKLDVMYFHGTTIDGTRFTIAGVIVESNLHMGISVCSERDIFRKSSGRSIATTRLLSEKNRNNLGRHTAIFPPDSIENEFKVFTTTSALFNEVTKKELLKTFNLRGYIASLSF